jgi:hypothetical protein
VCRQSSLLTGEGGEGGADFLPNRIIGPKESLSIYKSFNTLWSIAILRIGRGKHKFVATKEGMTTNIFHPSLFLLFLDPG